MTGKKVDDTSKDGVMI
jgi:hypothetical protein